MQGNEVPGNFMGYVKGPGIIQQVPWFKAGALGFPRDGYINYGRVQEQTCFHLPQFCNHGVTFPMWLWLESNMSKSNMIFKNSSNRGNAPGYRMPYLATKDKTVRVVVKTGVRMGLHGLPVETDKWMHVAFTWHSLG